MPKGSRILLAILWGVVKVLGGDLDYIEFGYGSHFVSGGKPSLGIWREGGGALMQEHLYWVQKVILVPLTECYNSLATRWCKHMGGGRFGGDGQSK